MMILPPSREVEKFKVRVLELENALVGIKRAVDDAVSHAELGRGQLLRRRSSEASIPCGIGIPTSPRGMSRCLRDEGHPGSCSNDPQACPSRGAAISKTCAWYDEDYRDSDPGLMPDTCSEPATHYSCCYALTPSGYETNESIAARRDAVLAYDFEATPSPLVTHQPGGEAGYRYPELPSGWTWQKLDEAITTAPTVAEQWRAMATRLLAELEGQRQTNREMHQGIAKRKAQPGDPTVRHVVAWMRATYPMNQHAVEWADEIDRVFLGKGAAR